MKRNYKAEVVSRLKILEGRAEVKEVGRLQYFPKKYPFYYLVAESKNPNAKNIFISASIHGDEPAGSIAALDFAQYNMQQYRADFNFVIMPCLNPRGFETGKHEVRHKIIFNRNLNREFLADKPKKEISFVKAVLASEARHYSVAIDMHEDDPRQKLDGFDKRENPNGFYIYEACSWQASIGKKIISVLQSRGFPINSREKIYWDKNDKGVVWQPWGAESRYEALTTLIAYMKRYTNHALNPETISTGNLEDRVQAHLLVLETVLKEFKKRSE